jgi:hypothetical protein
VPQSDEVRTALARVEGMLAATLPQHAAQLDEHSRSIAGITNTQIKHGERLASLETGAESRNRVPPWVAIVMMIAAVAAVNVTIIFNILRK